MAALAAAQVSKREAARTKNREDFPFAAEMSDLLAEFNPRLIYAEQGGKSVGRKPDSTNAMDGDRLVAMHDQFERTVTMMRKRK